MVMPYHSEHRGTRSVRCTSAMSVSFVTHYIALCDPKTKNVEDALPISLGGLKAPPPALTRKLEARLRRVPLSFSGHYISLAPTFLQPLPFSGHYISLATTFLWPLHFSGPYLSPAPTFLRPLS